MSYFVKIFMLIIFMHIVIAGKFFNIDNHRYYLSNPLKKNWHQALRFCFYHGMYLVDVNTSAENDRILSIVKNLDNANSSDAVYWTSGTDLGSEGSFYWASSGHQVLYNDYSTGQPDNGATNGENCLEIRGPFGFRWNDHICDEEKYFICRNSILVPIPFGTD